MNRSLPEGEDHYRNLGVSRVANTQQIKNAFRKLVKENHPDVGGTSDKFSSIKESYDVLNDPQRRGEYDAHLIAEAKKTTSKLRERKTFSTSAPTQQDLEFDQNQPAASEAPADTTHQEAAHVRPHRIDTDSVNERDAAGVIALVVLVLVGILAMILALMSMIHLPWIKLI
jgi:DnaJ-class molecular chaperone